MTSDANTSARGSPSSLRRAVEDIVTALQDQDRRVQEAEQDLKAAKARRTDLMAALSTLIRTLPAEDRKAIQSVIGDAHLERTESDAEVSGPIRAIMNMMVTRDKDTFRVEEVQNFLDDKGFDLSSRYAANTLRKLAEQGHLIRVGRGRYRLNELNIHAMGLMPEDYDEQE